MTWLGRGRRRVIVIAAGCVVVIAAVWAIVVVTKNDDPDAVADGSNDLEPAEILTDDQLKLIDQAVADPGCEKAPAAAPDDASLVALDVLRVDDTCLTVTTEYLRPNEVEDRRAELKSDPAVVEAAVSPPTWRHEVDDRRDDQWPLDLLGVPPDSVALPWSAGAGTVVAVIDTGVDSTHPDFDEAVIDRRHYPGEEDLDDGEHGTHVAGIIAARSDNGGIVGVTPGASILDVPVHLEDANEKAPSWFVGLPWAVNHGADVANMSLGGALSEYSKPEYAGALEMAAAVVRFAVNSDVVVIASAGNCGWPVADAPVVGVCVDQNERQVPAALDGVVAVGAVQDGFGLAGYSTRNEDVDLVAPGGGDVRGGVLSTIADDDYKSIQGTSQAAPHVAAAAAAIRSEHPGATVAQVTQALLDSADLDKLPEDDRSGAGRGFLDIVGALELIGEIPSDEMPSEAERTQAAYVHDGALYVFDGGAVQPVRQFEPESDVRWVQWSADRTLMVGSDERTLFSWAGDGSEAVTASCHWCASSLGVLVEDVVVAEDELEGGPDRPDDVADVIVRVDSDGTIIRYDARTLTELDTVAPAFPPDAVGTKTLGGVVGDQLLVHESGGAQASERLWLVDAASGEAELSHDVAGSLRSAIAVDAAGDQLAAVTNYGACGPGDMIYVLDGAGLSEVATVEPPTDMMVDQLFFNGDALYATMATYEFGDAIGCNPTGSTGVWRLDGEAWKQVAPSTVVAARPLEGRTGEDPTGWLVVRDNAEGYVEHATCGDPEEGKLGRVDQGLWATPTETEVEMADEPADCPST